MAKVAKSKSTGEQVPSIGHNKPPSVAEAIGEGLSERLAPIIKSVGELVARASKLPAKVRGDNHAISVGEWLKDVRTLAKDIESKRVDEKDEYIKAGRAVDGWFKALVKRLEDVQAPVSASLDAWAEAKEAAERRKAEAEAERLAAEAKRLEKIASRRKATEEDVMAAADVTSHAADASERAEASSADLVRTRSETATITVRKWWEGKLDDRAKLDLEQLRQHIAESALQSAINAFVRAGGRELTGATIEEKSSSMVL